MSSLPYGPPVQVSPLIRGIRFGLLIAGFFYAQGKKILYSHQEANFKIEEAKRKVIHDKEMAKIRAKVKAEEDEAIRRLEAGKF